MIIYDQLKRELNIDHVPQRIVSLVPSQTELLVDLGLKARIVGVTKFCVHPPDLRKSTTVVGGTKEVNYEKIRALNPDIIFCNKEENTPEMVRELEEICTVHVSDIVSIEDAIEIILQFGEILNVSDVSVALVKKFQEALQQFKSLDKPSRTVLYFIWRDPWMAAGKHTFINTLLELNNWKNIAPPGSSRYPEIKIEDLQVFKPDLVLLSSEPFPFKEKHRNEILKHYKGQTELGDGEYFSWYGSRLLPAMKYFQDLQIKLSNSL